MKVAYFTGVKQLEIRDRPRPAIERDDDVLVRIDCVGVCGSDVHYYLRGRIGDQIMEFPATVGHECSGTVEEVGANVAHLRPGGRVAIDPAISCGDCDQCRAGRVNTCRKLQFMGCPGEAAGAVAEYRVLPVKNCLPIPDEMTLEQAAFTEPLSIGLEAVRLADAAPGARVAVLGAGPIGQSVLLCLKATVDCKIYVTDLLGPRLEAATACGADWTGSARRDDVTAAIAAAEPLGLDRVFECSGDPACIDQAQRLLTPGGTLVMVGIPAEERVAFDVHTMRRKELTFQNVRRQKDCVAEVIRLVSAGHIDPTPLLTHRFALGQIEDAFMLVADYADGVIKATVELTR